MAWLGGWAKRIRMDIDYTDIDENLTNFPILIHLSSSSGINSEDATAIFDELQSNANRFKIAVTQADGTTQLYVDIEYWDDASEQAYLWVSRESWTISSSSTTTIYIYYDSTQADNTTYVGDSGDADVKDHVWDSNYISVYHFNETSGSHTDAAGSNSGTPSVTSQGTLTNSLIGRNDLFDGTDDYVTLGDPADLRLTGDHTIEAWCFMDFAEWPGAGTMAIAGRWHSTTNERAYRFSINCPYRRVQEHLSSNGYWQTGTQKTRYSANNSLDGDEGTWVHLACVTDISTTDDIIALYRNGSDIAIAPLYSDLSSINSNADILFEIGCDWAGAEPGYRNFFFDGHLDEVRISDTVRSVAWIKACYETGRDHLLDFYSEEVGGGTGSAYLRSNFVVSQPEQDDDTFLRSVFVIQKSGENNLSSSVSLPIESHTVGLGVLALGGSFPLGFELSNNLRSVFTLPNIDSAALDSEFIISSVGEKNLSSNFGVGNYVTYNLKSNVTVQKPGSTNLSSVFTLAEFTDETDLSSEFYIPAIQSTSTALDSVFQVVGEKTAAVYTHGEFSIISPLSKDLSSVFIIPKDWADLSSVFTVGYLLDLRFNYATCLYAAELVCEMAGLDWWCDDTEFFIGTKGVPKGTLDNITIGKSSFDREKRKNRIIAIGYDDNGNELKYIAQNAQSIKANGLSEEVYVEKNLRTLVQVQDFAQKKLAEQDQPMKSIPISMPTIYVVEKNLDVGDTVTIVDAKKNLNSSYRIKKMAITAATTKVDLELTELSLTERMRPLDNADPMVSPMYTNLPPVIDTTLGVNLEDESLGMSIELKGMGVDIDDESLNPIIVGQTLAPNIIEKTLAATTETPGGSTVALTNSGTTRTQTVEEDAFYYLNDIDVPSTNHEQFIVHAAVTCWEQKTDSSDYAFFRLKCTKTGETTYWIPSGVSMYICPMVMYVSNQHLGAAANITFVIPRNMAGYNIELQGRLDYIVSRTLSLKTFMTGYGILPGTNINGYHYHVASIEPADHEHPGSSVTPALHAHPGTALDKPEHYHAADVQPAEHEHPGSHISPTDHDHPGSTVSPTYHDHYVQDAEHVNPMTDKRKSHRRR